MVPVLNKLDVRCSVFGNHDFDFGIDTLMERVEKTNFPWLMSNVIDNETGRPLADGKVTHIIDWCGRKVGLVLFLSMSCDFTNYFQNFYKF